MKMKNREKSYCYHCDKMVNFVIKDVKETANIGEKHIPISHIVRRAYCVHCGTIVPCDEIDFEADRLIYDEYKKKVGLLSSLEIRSIRLKRGLSQRELSLMLGLGEKTITRYENGAIQDRAYDILLRLVDDNRGYRLIKKINIDNNRKKEDETTKLFKAINDYVTFYNKNNKNKIKEINIKYKEKKSIKLKKLIIN